MQLALEANFGSVQRWRDEVVALVQGQGGGPGWALLVFQPRDCTLVNQWAADTTPALTGGVPILALEMNEHAQRMHLGAAAGIDADAFLAHIHWAAVYGRYQHAVHAASEGWGATADALTSELAGALLLDVRRAGVFQNAATVIPGAHWRDPMTVAAWATELPADREVVVYCVYGHEVGRATAMRLRAAGVQARYLQGGIDAWQAAGRPVQPKGVGS